MYCWVTQDIPWYVNQVKGIYLTQTKHCHADVLPCSFSLHITHYILIHIYITMNRMFHQGYFLILCQRAIALWHKTSDGAINVVLQLWEFCEMSDSGMNERPLIKITSNFQPLHKRKPFIKQHFFSISTYTSMYVTFLQLLHSEKYFEFYSFHLNLSGFYLYMIVIWKRKTHWKTVCIWVWKRKIEHDSTTGLNMVEEVS